MSPAQPPPPFLSATLSVMVELLMVKLPLELELMLRPPPSSSALLPLMVVPVTEMAPLLLKRPPPWSMELLPKMMSFFDTLGIDLRTGRVRGRQLPFSVASSLDVAA